jgi:hypothetical protein
MAREVKRSEATRRTPGEQHAQPSPAHRSSDAHDSVAPPQTTVGNLAIGRVLAGQDGRTTPTVGKTRDPEEAEADQVADAVVRRQPVPAITRSPAPIGNEAQLQGFPEPPVDGGDNLAKSFRDKFEAQLDCDLAGVRIHTDSVSADAARAIGARAFTVGSHIAFAPGEFRPQEPEGERLLAHELAHVAQQNSGDAVVRRKVPDYSTAPEPPQYDVVVAALRELYLRKAALRDAPVVSTDDVVALDAQIQAKLADLALLGVRVDPDRVFEAVTRTPGIENLQNVNGRIVREPAGPIAPGDRARFHLLVDWLPPNEPPLMEWKWRTDAQTEGPFFDGRGFGGFRTRAFDKELDEIFWTGPIAIGLGYSYPVDWASAGGFRPVVRVHLGPKNVEVVGDWVPFTKGASERPFEIESAPKAIVGAPVEMRVKGWIPEKGRFFIDWTVDEHSRHHEFLGGSTAVTFLTAGTHRVRATLRDHEAVRDALHRGVGREDPALPVVADATVSVDVQDASVAAGELLDQMAKERPPEKLATLSASLSTSMAAIGTRAKMGGGAKAFWEARFETQQERLESLQRLVPASESTLDIPRDPATLLPRRAYSTPLSALLVYPSEGKAAVQPLSLYLVLTSVDGSWRAQIVDVTSRKVLEFAAVMQKPADAVAAAIAQWKSANPYPTGGQAFARFDALGQHHDCAFATTTGWKRAKEWVDGILQAGAIGFGVLLLAAPDAAVTKVLGAALLALGTARSAVAIGENLMLGYEPLDEANVLEAAVIITSFVGVAGGFVRAAGAEVRAVRPLMFRIGNWMVLSAVGSSVGTFVYASAQALDAVRAATADPTLSDDQKQAALMRVMASLLLNGALLIVVNRAMLRGMTLSDFVRGSLPGKVPAGTGVKIGAGTRLDLELELRRGGHEPERVRGMTDDQLVDAYGRRMTIERFIEEELADFVPDPVGPLDPASFGPVPRRRVGSIREISLDEIPPARRAYHDSRYPNYLKRHYAAIAAGTKKDRPPMSKADYIKFVWGMEEGLLGGGSTKPTDLSRVGAIEQLAGYELERVVDARLGSSNNLEYPNPFGDPVKPDHLPAGTSFVFLNQKGYKAQTGQRFAARFVGDSKYKETIPVNAQTRGFINLARFSDESTMVFFVKWQKSFPAADSLPYDTAHGGRMLPVKPWNEQIVSPALRQFASDRGVKIRLVSDPAWL